MPFWEEFLFAERFKVGFLEAYRMPRKVRAYLMLYAECKDAEIAEQHQAAARASR